MLQRGLFAFFCYLGDAFESLATLSANIAIYNIKRAKHFRGVRALSLSIIYLNTLPPISLPFSHSMSPFLSSHTPTRALSNMAIHISEIFLMVSPFSPLSLPASTGSEPTRIVGYVSMIPIQSRREFAQFSYLSLLLESCNTCRLFSLSPLIIFVSVRES